MVGGGPSGGMSVIVNTPQETLVTAEVQKSTRLADKVKAILNDNLPGEVSAPVSKYLVDPTDWLVTSVGEFIIWLWHDFFAFSSQESVVPDTLEDTPEQVLKWGFGSVRIDIPLLGHVGVPRIAVVLVAVFAVLQMLGSKPKKKKGFAKQLKKDVRKINRTLNKWI